MCIRVGGKHSEVPFEFRMSYSSEERRLDEQKKITQPDTSFPPFLHKKPCEQLQFCFNLA